MTEFTKEDIHRFNLGGNIDFWSQVLANNNGSLNTWAIYWYASIYLKRGLSLHSSQSFVSNIGHDGEGVHCAKTSAYDVDLIGSYPVSFTDKIREDKQARASLERYFKNSKVPFFVRVINRVNRAIKHRNGLC